MDAPEAEPQEAAPQDVPSLDDPDYRAGVVDLLGTLAYGELSAFLRLAADAELAPTLQAKGRVAALAAIEFHHHRQLVERLVELGQDPETAMAPFVAALDDFHTRTSPSDWLEGLVKYHVGDGIAGDFYREISTYLDPETRELVLSSLDTQKHAAFVVQEVRTAIAEDPKLGSRLALWGRRLVGEALSQGQRVAADREAFSVLLVGAGGTTGMGLVGIVEMFGRITERHTQRMAELGLSS
ncbi:ferritin-like fold-containing protein [Spongisporangium articulatum]|uniref:Ferritin-like fold-containing protein n=1 Tax=Spongisporangium articulatum TaxID=3362603 RepID=A0ABW8APZ2_9ACTN